MPNKYSYIDPEYVYTDPKTGILRNLADVTDHDTLTLVETGATSTLPITWTFITAICREQSMATSKYYRH
jgi:hypothetical protein